MRKRIILVGKGGSGKDYLAKKLIEKGYLKDISCTTRPKRDTEEFGIDYHFLTKDQFDNMYLDGKFYETADFNSWSYGTTQASWDRNQVFIMTPSGVAKIKPEDRKDCFIVYLDIPEDIRRERIALRSDADLVERRIEADRMDFENYTNYDFSIQDSKFDSNLIIDAWKSENKKSEYEILRPCMWFCEGQFINTVKFQEYFTAKAIRSLLDDGFIKLHMK